MYLKKIRFPGTVVLKSKKVYILGLK